VIRGLEQVRPARLPAAAAATSVPLRFSARDGFPLVGELFLPPPGVAPRATALVAAAMGVRRRLYTGFAAFLAEAGIATLTFDYRGIGDSRRGPLRGFRARLADWAELDLHAALAELERRAPAPGLPLYWIGHSVGGQLLGLLPDAPVARALFMGSQHGHWRNWDGLARVRMAALWHAVIPGFTATFGYLPMSRLIGGEDLPAGVAAQWAAWGRSRDYILDYLHARDGARRFAYAGPLRSYAVSDDTYAPRRTVEALLAAFPHAQAELCVIAPRDLGVHRIGHFELFRPQFRSTWWTEARAWLLA
jgi:predicted alpha/beta hydrolase